MKEADYNKVIQIIDEEVENGSIEDLLELKEYLLNSISKKQEKKAEVSDVMDVLTMDLKSFLYQEIDPIHFRSFKPGVLITAIRRVKKYDKIRKVYVLDLMGINEQELLLQSGVGLKTITTLNGILSKYGLSLKRQLTFDERTLIYKNINSQKVMSA